MKFKLSLLVLLAFAANLFAAGKIYWQANGILMTDRDGMTAGSPVPDGQGGVIVFASDGMDSIFAIKIDKNGNLPWTLRGKVLDDNGFGGFQGGPKSVSDGKNGAIAIWSRWYPWGHNLYYNRIDSLGNKAWAGNGVPLTLSDSTQEYHQVVSDGAGGAIAAWQEQRNGQWDIYAQRVDSMGLRQWGDYGKVVCNAGGGQRLPKLSINIISGVIICWWDERNDVGDVYCQRIDLLGDTKWGSNGIAIVDTSDYQAAISVVSGNNDKWLIAWSDRRSGNYNIYAQSIDSGGSYMWDYLGTPVCIISGDKKVSKMVSDSNGGSIDSWVDTRNGNNDIFAQRIGEFGEIKWINTGVAICNLDSTQESQNIFPDNSSGAVITWQDKRSGNYDIYAQHVDSSGNVKWQINGMAICTTTYDQVSPEMAPSDSNTAIIIWSDGRSGYYRGYAQRVGDDPDGVAGNTEDRIPNMECRLEQNHPNPFHQSTMINYQIPKTGIVSLKVYNITGQLVRTLVDTRMAMGSYSYNWDGKDDRKRDTGNGIYFYQLQVDGNITKTNKMIKLR